MNIDGVGNLCLWCMEDKGDSLCCPHCGHDERETMRSEQAIPAGNIIGGHYLIGRTLGQGGFGITYLAYDLDLHIKRAIKEYFPQGLVIRVGNTVKVSRQSAQDVYQKGVDAFYREAQSVAVFGGHPNVVQVHAFFRENNSAYFVMDYVEGISFKQYLDDRDGRISWEETLRILKPIGEALTALHEAHLLHRDVKPENIFITRNGTPKLLDFGAARYETSECTHSSAAVLTPGYAPVEQYGTMSRQGTFTDVYALSATFYRAVSGVVPIPAPDRMDSDPLLPLDKLDRTVPAGVGAAIGRGMAVRREKRTQSVAELLKDLEGKKNPKTSKWLLPVLAALAIVLMIGIWRLGGRSNDKAVFRAQTELAEAQIIFAEQTETEAARIAQLESESTRPAPAQDPTRTSVPSETAIPTATLEPTRTTAPTNTATATLVPTQSVITDEIRNAQTGDTIYFGQYEQDNNSSNGTEAIEWRVLTRDDSSLMLISEYGLEAKPYNEDFTAITWEKCTLRDWLNGEFYQSAFNAEEQKHVKISYVTVEDNAEFGVDAGSNTLDLVFLLSTDEAEKYFKDDEDRLCQVTPYAKAHGARGTHDSWWWLRTVGYRSDFAADVNPSGYINTTECGVDNTGNIVRPVFWLSL